jgi:hypothetical protein
MSLLLVAATSYKANNIPFLMLGGSVFLLSYIQGLRRQQASKGKKSKALDWIAIGLCVVGASGFAWILLEVSRLP